MSAHTHTHTDVHTDTPAGPQISPAPGTGTEALTHAHTHTHVLHRRVGVPAVPRGDGWAAVPRGRGPAQPAFASRSSAALGKALAFFSSVPGFGVGVSAPLSLQQKHGSDHANENLNEVAAPAPLADGSWTMGSGH